MAKMRTVRSFTVVAGLALLHVASERPIWLKSKISQFEGVALTSPPRAILRTTYQGKSVYYVPPVCCDIPSELYDDGGVLLCFPGGGFAGGDGRCPAFALPVDVTTVWRDSRGASNRGPLPPSSK